jgi:hypothetical protein
MIRLLGRKAWSIVSCLVVIASLSACQLMVDASRTPSLAGTPADTAPPRRTPTVLMPVPTLTPPPTEAPINIASVFPAYHKPPVNVSFALAAEPIAPDLSNVESRFVLSEDQRARLAQDGVVVSPGSMQEFYMLYEGNRYSNVPNFVTSDSLLHAYHLVFDKVLATAEEEQFSRRLIALSKSLLAEADSQYRALQGASWEEPARRTVAYFAVGCQLLGANASIPSYVQDIVDAEVAQIEAHQGTYPSEIFPGTMEDYTQYIPRGHYADNETLTPYFKAMMWYGRMTFHLNTGDPEQARSETRSALLLVQALRTATVDEQPALVTWNEIYTPTTFFVGGSNNLTVLDYIDLAEQVYGVGFTLSDLQDESRLDTFMQQARQRELALVPDIPPGSASLEPSQKGLQFFGQRFVLDSYVFRQLLFDNISTESDPRMLPKGLDVMAAFGSERAYAILEDMGETDYDGYPEQMAALQGWVAGFDTPDWTSALFTTWLYTFQPLLETPGEGYPQFMQSQAWLDKQLNTCLGSWTELRHDTILYAQPSFPEAGGGPGPPAPLLARGYVEPVPQFYARLRALAAMTREGLASYGLVDEGDVYILGEIESLAEALQIISEKELRGEPLTESDEWLIRGYGSYLENLLHFSLGLENISGEYLDYEKPQAAIVADVATNGSVVLEEATGRINEIYVIVPLVNSDGSIALQVASGGTFAYYEFTHSAGDRLTDDAWRQMLENDSVPPLPAWTSSFLTTETEYSSITHWIYSFERGLTWGYWLVDETEMSGLDSARQQFAAEFADLRSRDEMIGRTLVNVNYLSVDFQSADQAVVTAREVWQDELYRVREYDENGYYPNKAWVSSRGPYTLEATYTLRRVPVNSNGVTTYDWRVSRVVYADQPPDWETDDS